MPGSSSFTLSMWIGLSLLKFKVRHYPPHSMSGFGLMSSSGRSHLIRMFTIGSLITPEHGEAHPMFIGWASWIDRTSVSSFLIVVFLATLFQPELAERQPHPVVKMFATAARERAGRATVAG